jgi:hypothetical protein
MEKEIGRVHRLALPLVVKRKGTAILVSDGLFGHEFEFKDFGQIKVIGIDSDGFVTFELSTPEQQTLIESSSSPRKLGVITGSFTQFGSGTAKTSSSIKRGSYDYFKRSTDEFYYAVHKLGTKTKRIYLGSIQEPASDIRQILSATRHFGDSTWFDRKQLIPLLKPSQRHGQKLKSALDILVLEGYLERTESHKRGKIHEQYKITSKEKAFT